MHIHRYDFIFFCAIAFQIVVIVCKLESIDEIFAIIVFHILAMAMEIYKVRLGSWVYPQEGIFKIYSVPLFTGFMYSSVGSYIVRSFKIYDATIIKQPKMLLQIALVTIIYVNFFTNHYIYDFRYIFIIFTIAVYFQTYILVREKKFHILLFFILATTLVWLAENILSYVKIWLYPNQKYYWHMVSFGKYISWYLLIVMSFSLISVLKKLFYNRFNSSIIE